jgi:hypothetical protein
MIPCLGVVCFGGRGGALGQEKVDFDSAARVLQSLQLSLLFFRIHLELCLLLLQQQRVVAVVVCLFFFRSIWAARTGVTEVTEAAEEKVDSMMRELS